MTKLSDLTTEMLALVNNAWIYALDTAAGTKDQKIKISTLRGIDVVETLTSKTLNNPATAKPAYVSTLQLIGAKLTRAQRGTGNLAPGVLAAGAEIVVTLTVAGLAVNDHVIVNPTAAMEAGLVIAYARVSAADTLSVSVRNTGIAATAGTAIPDRVNSRADSRRDRRSPARAASCLLP